MHRTTTVYDRISLCTSLSESVIVGTFLWDLCHCTSLCKLCTEEGWFADAAAFMRTCKLEGSVQFTLHLQSGEAKLYAASTNSNAPISGLSSVPPKYHDFADVFSKAKSTQLPPHHDFDLKIDLEDGSSPPLGTIYSLSLTELEALRTFIDEHLCYGFIRLTNSAHAAPVLCQEKGWITPSLCGLPWSQ